MMSARGQLRTYSVEPGVTVGPLPRNTRHCCIHLQLGLLQEQTRKKQFEGIAIPDLLCEKSHLRLVKITAKRMISAGV